MPDDKQLKERLRRKARKRGLATIVEPELFAKAADTIERLEAERDRDAAVLEEVGAESQRWLDADVKNQPYIERLEERQSELETALRPLLEAKPMPSGKDDVYVLQGVTGKVLRAAKRAFAGSALLPAGEVVTDPDDPLLQPDDPALQHAQEQVGEDRG